MKILVVGAGVIGTVYGAHLAAAGHTVSVLAHQRGPVTSPVPGSLPAMCSLAARCRRRCRSWLMSGPRPST